MTLLSQYPILESEIFNNPNPNEDIALDSLVYIRSVLDVDGQQVVIFNFHPPIPQTTPIIKYDDTAISYHFETVLERVRTETLPVILTCDCNAPPPSRQYQWMDEELDEAHAQSGWGFGLTFKGVPYIPIPLIRIDYIWFDEHFTALGAEVLPYDGPSDHRPVSARLDLHRE